MRSKLWGLRWSFRKTIFVGRRTISKANLAKLEVPDPKKDGRLPDYLEVCERVSAEVKDSNVSGLACGPWQIAVLLRGAEALIRDTFKDPGFVHELMKFTVEVADRFIMAQKEQGIGPSFSEATCSLNLIRILSAAAGKGRWGLPCIFAAILTPLWRMWYLPGLAR